MKHMLLSILLVLLAIPARADCGRKEWHTRVRSILVRLFPNDEMASNVRLVFICDPRPDATYSNGNMVIDSGLMKFKRAEIAAVLAQEMGHAKLEQDIAFGLFGESLAALEKDEIDADDFSLVTLRRAGYGPCDAYHAMAKALPYFPSILKNPTGPHNRIVVHRFGRLQEACKQGGVT